MSLVDIDQLSPLALVSQYIAEVRGKASFLTRDEVGLVEKWLELAKGKPEPIILILEAEFSQKQSMRGQKKSSQPSMKRLDRLMSNKLRDQIFLTR
jgi:hypothetical protein